MRMLKVLGIEILKGKTVIATHKVNRFHYNPYYPAGSRVTYEFYNNSRMPLKVIDRQCMPIYLKPVPMTDIQEGLYIVKCTMLNDDLSNMIAEKAMILTDNPDELEFYRDYGPRPLVWSGELDEKKDINKLKPFSDEWYRRALTHPAYKSAPYHERKTVYFLPIEHIDETHGFYDELTDLLITYGHGNKTPAHPYAPVGNTVEYFFEKTKKDSEHKRAFEGYSYYISNVDRLTFDIPKLYKRSGSGYIRIDPEEPVGDFESGRLYINWDEVDPYGKLVTKTDSIMVINPSHPNYLETVLEPWLANYGIFTSVDKLKQTNKAVEDIHKRMIEIQKLEVEREKMIRESIREELKLEFEKEKHVYLKEELQVKRVEVDVREKEVKMNHEMHKENISHKKQAMALDTITNILKALVALTKHGIEATKIYKSIVNPLNLISSVVK